MITDQVYPPLSRAFYAQIWACIAFLSIITVSLIAGLLIRLRRRRFDLVIKDGSLTRLDHKICVPVLWTLEAIRTYVLKGLASIDQVLIAAFSLVNLILNVIYRHQVQRRSFDASLGRLLLLVHIPLHVSYALLMGNVLASAPAIRRAFGKLPNGRLWFNLGLALMSSAMCASLFPSAFASGDALQQLSQGYAEVMRVIDGASATHDATRLADLGELLTGLGK